MKKFNFPCIEFSRAESKITQASSFDDGRAVIYKKDENHVEAQFGVSGTTGES